MKIKGIAFLVFFAFSVCSFAATVRDNHVVFSCSGMDGFKSSDASFSMTEYRVSDGQPFDGVSSSVNKDGNFDILVKAGRHKTGDVATWYDGQCPFGMISEGSARDSSPDKLNFAISGTLVLQGNSYRISLGQGHSDSTLHNNWWLGGIDVYGSYEGGSVTTCDGLFTITAKSADELSIVRNKQNSDWIGSKVQDMVMLNEMSIPGTHDTGTFGINNFFLSNFAITQTASITQQLLMGIRAMDIRCTRSDADGGSFGIFHGSVYCNLRFDQVVSDCISFLKKHPGEFVVLMIQHENPGNDDKDAPSFEDIFKKYISNFGAENFWLKNEMPSVGDVRGKIVITNRGEISEGIRINWQDNCIFTSQAGVNFKIQDCYNCSLSNKLNYIESTFNDSFNDTKNSMWFVNFTSGYDVAPYPVNRAKDVNPVVRDFLLKSPAGKTGIVLMDFAGSFGSDDSISNIIGRN